MWSNQATSTDYFAVHRDDAPTSTWTVETAITGTKEADDHINLKTFEGRVYVAVKTSQSGSTKQLIRLLVRAENGTWNRYGVATVAQFNTRPIAMLSIDPVQHLVYVFMTIGEGDLANGIAYKVSSTNSIGFPSSPMTFIQGPNGERINNATSMKDNADPSSGIVVMASDGTNYWWNRIGGGGPANTPPTAAGVSASGAPDQPLPVGLSGTDAETCELTFAIVSGPSSGALSGITGAPCVAGVPNTDSASVTYTPQPGFTGSDSFTYSVTDGGGASATGVATLT
ncbi:MAG: Ig-like domain-containing protein, partial [Actinomycetota bacterium]